MIMVNAYGHPYGSWLLVVLIGYPHGYPILAPTWIEVGPAWRLLIPQVSEICGNEMLHMIVHPNPMVCAQQ